MSLLKRLAERNLAAPDAEEALQLVAPSSRIQRASGVRSGNIQRGQMVAIPEDYFKGLVEAEDRRPETSRVGGNSDGFVHVSSLVNACARREAIAAKYQEPVIRRVLPTDRIIWKIGRAVEHHIRSQIIKAVDGQGVYGKWSCRCGDMSHVGMRPNQSTRCTTCRSPAYSYEEEPVWDDEHGLVGNCDLPFLLGDYLIPVEVKSMKKDEWEALSAPKGDHVTQVASYHRMFERNGWKVHDHAIIIYASKAAIGPRVNKGSPYKEYKVNCRDQSVVSQVNAVFEAGAIIKRHRDAGTLPPRTLCQTVASRAAKECPMMSRCFNLD